MHIVKNKKRKRKRKKCLFKKIMRKTLTLEQTSRIAGWR
jgi:hypothetical protein